MDTFLFFAVGLAVFAAANAFWWWMWGRHQAADRVAALRRAVRVEGERDRLIRELYAAQERNALLESANKRLSSGEVIETLTDRLEGQT
jgi:hypothetical protein